MVIIVNRSIDTSSYPAITGKIPFSIVEQSDQSNIKKPNPEAYVIDIQSDLNAFIERTRRTEWDLDGNIVHKPVPAINLQDNSVLAYYWGQRITLPSSFSINQVQVDTNASSVLVNLELRLGPATALSWPYIIAMIPKLPYKRFVFDDHELP